MNEFVLKNFILGEISTNSYIIFHKKTREAFIIDSSLPNEEVKDFIQQEKLVVLFVALTHGHFDHIAGIDDFNVPVYVHPKDAALLNDEFLNGSAWLGRPVAIKRKTISYIDGSRIAFGSHFVDVIHTPGHTEGSVSLKLGNWLFSGDALFFHSIGRTDFPNSSHDGLMRSLRDKLLVLPADTFVYPGHGPATTIKEEAENNPFLS